MKGDVNMKNFVNNKKEMLFVTGSVLVIFGAVVAQGLHLDYVRMEERIAILEEAQAAEVTLADDFGVFQDAGFEVVRNGWELNEEELNAYFSEPYEFVNGESARRDPWGTKYQWCFDDRKVEFISAGEDKVFDTEDDRILEVWK